MTTEEKISELKKELILEGQKEKTDLTKISSLLSKLSELDESNVRFSVDAGIINRLGKELVGRHETAVSELVKNAYDADASNVQLIFENAWSPGGTLSIKDDGIGMTREQLVNGFMRLSSTDKIHNPTSTKYGRIRAGRKGIGRFATQRLGGKLTIITQTLNSEYALKVTIDWGEFKTDQNLFEIASPIEVTQKTKDEGTDLIIEFLRDGWSDAMIRRAFRYTSDLLQPFPLSKKKKEEAINKNNIDPGFQSSYFRKEGDVINKIIDEEDVFYNHAVAEIEGYVLDDGQGCWSLKSDVLNFPTEVYLIGKDKEIPESRYNFIKGVHFKCYYFIYESSLLPAQVSTLIREVANERGGIRVYRNGFRVLPYGEKLNDWLGLDESTARRVILGSHRNINFFGFVELTDSSGVLFDETSSREGLFENDAFKEVVDFVSRSIISAVLKVSEIRGKKGATSLKNWKQEENEPDPTQEVDKSISELESTISGSEEMNFALKAIFSEVVDRIKEGRQREKEKLGEEKQSLTQEINMLRILAGLGLVIGEFVHEVKRFLPGFDTDTRFLKKAVKDYSEALSRVERLETNIKSFTVYTSYFDKAISRNVLREIEPIELRDVVNEFSSVIKTDLERTGIKLHKPSFEGFDLFTVPMHPSEWASILFNFYTNAKKAIRRKRVSGELFIKCGRANGNIYLEFSDNGIGIPKKIENEIFNAFFTTSSAVGHNSSDSETLTGTGLGLKIVRDIAESYGGKTFVASPDKNFSTTIRIEIPENPRTNGKI